MGRSEKRHLSQSLRCRCRLWERQELNVRVTQVQPCEEGIGCRERGVHKATGVLRPPGREARLDVSWTQEWGVGGEVPGNP